MTMTAGLVLVAYCFKYAKLAGINQGCLPCIFSLCTIYICILFYFKFNERISYIKILGSLLMIPCIALISLGAVPQVEESSETVVSETYTDKQKQEFALLSISFAMIVPLFLTTRAMYYRLSENKFRFNLFDLAIDGQIF